ncbi:MAG: DUF1761 family protein [Microbacterium sp.]|uniref:DUF1761 family protein n=1 Tax=Microbacterium sp. TaxID=51671 RepID=UPI001DA8AB56|nr:DUF1761 family protein [Microbacterium sp.]MBW8763930.1 DUF1761 family protein [Microbacterium sp.]
MIALGILIATIASFIASAVLYAIPPVSRLVTRTSTPRPGIPVALQMLSVVARSLLASFLIAGLMTAAGWHGPAAGALLGLALSVLPLVLLFGGVVHENTAVPTAGIHLLDWIIKLTLIGILVGLFV